MKRIGTSKPNITSDLKDALIGVAGGIAANQASTMLEKSAVLGANSKIAPLAVAALSLAAYIFMPKGSALKNAAYGAFIVAGTEQAEDLTSGLMSGEYVMGFTPQLVPAKFEGSIESLDGVLIR
jgi:hypothetical protein